MNSTTIGTDDNPVVCIINGVELHVSDMKQNFIIGLIYSTTSLIFLALTLIILYIFFKYREYRTNISYKLMIINSLIALPQQCVHFLSGFYSMFTFTSSQTVDKILGGMCQSGYMTSIILTTVLALNRLDIISSKNLFPTISRNQLFLTMAGIIIGYGILLFAFFNSPITGLYYGIQDNAWHYLRSTPNRELAKTLEYWTCVISVVITFLIYIVIVIILIKQKTNFKTAKTDSQFKIIKPLVVSRNERNLLLQVILNFAYVVILEVFWFYGSYFLPDSRFTAISLNYMWLGNSGINTLLYILTLRDVRRKLIFISSFGKYCVSINVTQGGKTAGAAQSRNRKTTIVI